MACRSRYPRDRLPQVALPGTSGRFRGLRRAPRVPRPLPDASPPALGRLPSAASPKPSRPPLAASRPPLAALPTHLLTAFVVWRAFWSEDGISGRRVPAGAT